MSEKEQGQLFAEAWFNPDAWSSLDEEERAQCAKLEAVVRNAALEEAARIVERNVGSMNVKARHADEFAASIRALKR